MKKTLIATALAALLVTPLVYAEEAKENGEKKEEEKSYSDLIKDLDAHEGLFKPLSRSENWKNAVFNC